ncbi:holo-ACP synthase [Salinivibrio kushneri]|uniref:holo-ACP synthase n=1 Tax=Salinivibrio kushneri TaxID=1908198 RepID=UPI0022B536CD|nr:holo-ACP synthase [Salinivibrio kushneri]WBA18397.1 holo-ACP synthase [Salinivibrio kushneri]
MAIAGIGTDIVEIARVERVLARQPRFAARILTESEQANLARHHAPGCFLAKRFAAKEAAAKALGTGIANGVTFHDFIITNQASGQPTLRLSGRAAELAQVRGITQCWLTLSDEKAYAIAYVVLETA